MPESLEGRVQSIISTKGSLMISSAVGAHPSLQKMSYVVKDGSYLMLPFMTTKTVNQISFNPKVSILIEKDNENLKLEGRGKIYSVSKMEEWKKQMIQEYPSTEKDFEHPLACFIEVKPLNAEIISNDEVVIDETVEREMLEYPTNKLSTFKTMKMSFMLQLKKWVRIIRVPFWTATIIPVLLGLSIVYANDYSINWFTFALTMCFSVMAHSAANILNDYFDHIYKGDEKNQYWSPLNGGSRMIQLGIVTPNKTLLSALFFYFGSIGIFSYLYSLNQDPVLLTLGIAGYITVLFYNQVIKIGLGELFIFLGFGPIMILTAYYIQTSSMSADVIFISFPIGILITLVLFINGFQDAEADNLVNKRTLVVMLKSKKRAAAVYQISLVVVYAMVIIGIIIGYLPLYSLIAFLPIILAIKATSTLRKHYNSIHQLYPANGMTIILHLTTGLLLSLAFVLDKLV